MMAARRQGQACLKAQWSLIADLTMAEASLHEQLCAVKATCASQGAALLTVQKDTDAARSAFATTFVQHMVSTALLHARLNEAEAQQAIAQQAAKASTTTLEQSGAEVEQLRASMAAQCRDMCVCSLLVESCAAHMHTPREPRLLELFSAICLQDGAAGGAATAEE